jgi:L-seryl-tRNA(Ser) seleniumtransferase
MVDARAIPSIEHLCQRPAVRALVGQFGRDAVVDALRAEAQAVRDGTAGAAAPGDRAALAGWIEQAAARRLTRSLRPSLGRVINATGVIVHTNLGRAPLPAEAVERIAQLAPRYTNLEYDLVDGRRGARDVHAEALLCRLTGAAAAVVVNNCAAATLLVLAALARGREVLVSRGELVEIGGGFRVPDVMAQSGARLREVGTTNRTRVADYALALGERTALILRVHPSNFRIEGFVERPALAELAALGRRFSVPVVEDLGSGLLATEAAAIGALAAEPTVPASIAAGADLVCFSGDKLLGGPQAGVIAGRRDLVTTIRRHPLMRALRVDKLTYAALEATILAHLAGRAAEAVPVVRMAALSAQQIGARAEVLARALRGSGWQTEVIDGSSAVGGGSAPGAELPTRLLAVWRQGLTADALDAHLRALDPPVVARIEAGRVVLDLRTVAPDEDALVETLLAGVNA